MDGHHFVSYTDEEFLNKQRQYDILTINLRFKLNDLKLFYQIVFGLVPIPLPDYIAFADPVRVRYTRNISAIIDSIE